MNYDALVRDISGRLGVAGIEESGLEARLLVMHVAGLTRTDLIARGTDPVPQEVAEPLERLVSRRLTREPLQHILGWAHFFGLELMCDARALIPRADSEVVVEAALHLLPEDVAVQVADLGTGSGCLLAAILSERPHAIGQGVDASADAAALAAQNMAHLDLESRARIYHQAWADWTGWGQADLVISNPPYIRSADLADLQPEVIGHDPHSALDGGGDGLAAYREIVGLASKRLKPGAWLVFEVGFDQKADVIDLLSGNGFCHCESAQDLGGRDRAVWGQSVNK